MNNIMEKSVDLCIGCSACTKVCPKNCIELSPSVKGFYVAIPNDTCINCGLCKKVCYKFIEDDGMDINDSKGYLSYNLNQDIRRISSSGGVGHALSMFAIKNEFDVCGVEYNYKLQRAEHVILNDENELTRIIGSKYIPSYTVEAIEKLDKNRKYLFIGTPCQIYGIRKLQEFKKLDNLILVDFFCHGTPSLNLWNKYLKMITDKYDLDKINYINFRDKEKGWHNFSLNIKDANNNTYSKTLYEDIFLKFFLENVDLNLPCYNCKLRFNKIYSDIRLGDFWGPKCKKDEKGTSIILSNTPLGEQVLKKLEDIKLEEIHKVEIDQSQKQGNIPIPKEYSIVQQLLLSDMELEDIYKVALLPKLKRQQRINIIRKPMLKVRGAIRRGKVWMQKN